MLKPVHSDAELLEYPVGTIIVAIGESGTVRVGDSFEIAGPGKMRILHSAVNPNDRYKVFDNYVIDGANNPNWAAVELPDPPEVYREPRLNLIDD